MLLFSMSAAPIIQEPGFPLLDPSTLVPALNFTVVKDGASLEKMRRWLYSGITEFGHDYETNITKAIFERRARTLQLGDKNEQYIIDWMEWVGGRDALFASQGHFGGKSFYGAVDYAQWKMIQPVVDVIRPAFNSGDFLKLGHNLEFEYLVSRWCFGMRPWNFYDTQMAEKVIYCGKVDFFAQDFWGLDDLVRRRIGIQIDKQYQKIDWMEERTLTETELIYCALDARIPFSLRNLQKKDIDQGRLQRTIYIEMHAIPPFGDMKLHGFKQNELAWRELMEGNVRERTEVVTELDKLFVPLVGSRHNEPDPAIVSALEDAWRDMNNLTPEEEVLAAEIRTLRKKDADTLARKAALVQQRDTLQAARRAKRDENRKLYQAASKAHNKFFKDKEGWLGEACINYGSPAALHKALLASKWFSEKEKKALTSTDKKVLEKFAHKPVVKLIRKFKKLDKLIGTYGDSWLRYVNDPEGGFTHPLTGRLHSDIIQLGAETGRTSSREPNFQNLPRKKEYRKCFISRDGWKMLTIDYSGCELRILAELSGEQAWIDAFNNGWDVHSMCAHFLYKHPWEEGTVHEAYEVTDEKTGKTKTVPKCAYFYKDDKGHDHQKCECPLHEELRAKLKAVNFGIAYGKTAFGLAADLEITQDEAEQLLRDFAATFPTLWKYLDDIAKEGIRKWEARTMADRRRIFTKIEWAQAEAKAVENLTKYQKKYKILPGNPRYKSEPNHNDKVRAWKQIEASIMNQAKNTPIQGTNADVIKLALGSGSDKNGVPFQWHRLEPEFGALLENMVHDEQVIEAPDETAQPAFEYASDCMTRAGAEFISSVVMESEGHIATHWTK